MSLGAPFVMYAKVRVDGWVASIRTDCRESLNKDTARRVNSDWITRARQGVRELQQQQPRAVGTLGALLTGESF